ncbi:lipid-A-disaccharide synthase [Exilibacterium tricleocarpae]|uniref:Lipid-A-disaccharide synthase n=1 Tax=Exilibacterium tricleocarpae TaxID=2591008 RepID=A0A545U878_9GAMM|nr:lipid-A-disaccharide synthase [Exilibacterium tricleocarpae]TQV85659.1 lipid-A-disaccharide synthase [Exilibacterium tricleocarpae]
MGQSLRIGMVVGEASGDILGAGLMSAIRDRHPAASFVGVGGPRMLALGFESLYAQDRLAVMGYIEPLKRLPELLRMRAGLKRYFTEHRPDLFVGIDSPDFNLDLERALREAGIPTVHYVSPSVWAWKQKRIVKIARSVDLMLTLFPFEADFYRRHQVAVEFVGHPLADTIPLACDTPAARHKLGIEAGAEVIALMPGSRGGEIKFLAPVFLQTARWCLQRRPNLRFVLPAANSQRRQQLELMVSDYGDLPLTLLDGDSHTAMAAADAVLMASGTTTLEALLLKRPMVVAYKMAALSYAIVSRMVKSEFISLPNLLAGQQLVPEILQSQATPENLGAALLHYLEQPDAATALQSDYLSIHRQLRCDASARAAAAVLNLIGRGA